MNLLEILNFSKEYLQKYSFSKPRLESEKVISNVLKLDRITLYAYFDMELSSEQKEKVKAYLKEMARKRIGFDELLKSKDIKVETVSYKEENLELLNKSAEYLKKYGVASPKLDAEYIFAYILGVNRLTLTLNFNKKIEEKDKEKIREYLILRGKNRKPLQYLLGEWEFYGYPFKVDERVLIPRSDTEILVEQCKFILNELENPKVLDIGTGSGAIAVTLGKECPNSVIIGADISEGALEVAEANREMNKAENVKFMKSDVFSSFKDMKFDFIISNPPYIPLEEYNKLMPEVLKYEPSSALTDNGNGYYFYSKISKEASDYLNKGGFLAFEVGYNQAETVKELMEENGFDIFAIVKDYGGIDRVVIGKKSGDK